MNRHVILGTAGHIDHGKSALVQALTGTDPDRLKEEKERGITIDLGFADLSYPDGLMVGIVDVPGHERLIKNMLAGAGGIDIVLMVIAADEGIMPQSREHLDICNLLKVKRGLIAITKSDLVEEDWIALVEDEVRNFVQASSDCLLTGYSHSRVSVRWSRALQSREVFLLINRLKFCPVVLHPRYGDFRVTAGTSGLPMQDSGLP